MGLNYNYDYKPQRYKRKANGGYLIKIAAIVLCVLLTFMFVSLMTGGFVIFLGTSNEKYIKTSAREYYFINFNTFESLAQAENAALQIKIRGGAGYIHKENAYRVFAAAYKDKQSAETVAKRLGSPFSVHKVPIKSIKIEIKSDNVSSKKIKNAVDAFYETIDILYDAYINIDGSLKNEITAVESIKQQKEKIEKINQELNQLSLSDSSIILLKTELLSLQINLNILCDTTYTQENISVKVKYYMIKIILNTKKFATEIG